MDLFDVLTQLVIGIVHLTAIRTFVFPFLCPIDEIVEYERLSETEFHSITSLFEYIDLSLTSRTSYIC